MHPVWRYPASLWSPEAWGARFGWVDPLTLAIKDGLPFTEQVGRQFTLFAPVVWLAVAIVLWWYGRISASSKPPAPGPHLVPADLSQQRASPAVGARSAGAVWLVLAAVLLAGGTAGPDSLGLSHGEFLPQRVVLLGLAAMAPVFDFDLARWPGRALAGALLTAVGLQSAVVWDYALYSDRTAGQLIRAGRDLGHNQRIVTLLVNSRSRFRPNPLLHAENWLGVNSGNIIWNNYETLHYYFPVQFRPEIERPHPGDLELVSLHEDAKDTLARLRDWELILSRYAHTTDVIILWKRDEGLEAITSTWFELADRQGDVQIFRRRGARDAR